MSKHHNYTKYSGQTTSPAVEEVVETAVQEEVVETVETVEEELKTPQVPVAKAQGIVQTLEGVVNGCSKLNVRELPNANAEVLCKIDRYSRVEIHVEESTSEFYKVCTEAGVEGFCMKKFIDTK